MKMNVNKDILSVKAIILFKVVK